MMMMINQDNWSNHSDEDQNYSSIEEEVSRRQLIQRATTRLRRRLLEEKLQDVMRHLAHVQARLETVRVDTAATIRTVADMPEEATEEGIQKMNRQMDILEKRLESHKLDLDQFLPYHSQEQQPVDLAPTASSSSTLTALSMSRLSSLSIVPSFFGGASRPSTRATSVCSESFKETQLSSGDELQKKEKRRKRVKHQKRRYQESVVSHSNSAGSEQDDWHRRILCTAGDEEEEDDPFYDLAGKRSFRAGSFCGSVYCETQGPQTPLPQGGHNRAEFASRRRQRRKEFMHRMSSESLIQRSDDHHHPLSPTRIHFEHQPGLESSSDDDEQCSQSSDILTLQSHYLSTQLYPERNILDEAMSFLDGVEESSGDDGGFREDLYLLLRNPDLCCRPFSEIESTMHELRQQEQNKRRSSNIHDMMYSATLSTLQWCRFLSVLSAAVVISILKGPEDLLHNPPISR